MRSARLMTAIHAMTMLGLAQRAGVASVSAPEIAYSVSTNPVLVRRLMAQLKERALVDVTRGANGGVRLACPAGRISLADIAEAVGADELGLGHYAPGSPSARCDVAPHISSVVGDRLRAAEAALHAELATVTLGSLVADITDRMESTP